MVKLPTGVVNDEYYVLEYPDWGEYHRYHTRGSVRLCAPILLCSRRDIIRDMCRTDLTHCFIATDVEKVSGQHLDATEDIEVHLFSSEEVRAMLERGCIRQALMAAPLWKYFAK